MTLNLMKIFLKEKQFPGFHLDTGSNLHGTYFQLLGTKQNNRTDRKYGRIYRTNIANNTFHVRPTQLLPAEAFSQRFMVTSLDGSDFLLAQLHGCTKLSPLGTRRLSAIQDGTAMANMCHRALIDRWIWVGCVHTA